MASWLRRAVIGAVLIVAEVAGAAEGMTTGPYRVGFVQIYEDRTGFPPNPWHRVNINIFYPVDPASVDGSTPRATYNMNPDVSDWLLPSGEWEALGFPAAYDAVTPSGAGPFPLFVFSAGYGNSWVQSMFLAPRVASYGYVVATLSHYPEGGAGIGQRAIERNGDVGLAIDRLLQRSATVGDLFEGTVDGTRLILGGFSLGGYNAMARAGGDDLVCDTITPPIWDPPAPVSTCIPIAPDPRVRALVLLDASNQLLKFEELARIQVPAIAIGEDFNSLVSDYGDIMGPWQARQHAALSGEPSYRVGIKRSHHGMFANPCHLTQILCKLGYYGPDRCKAVWEGNRCHITTFQDRMQVLIRIGDYVIAFLETEVRGAQGYQAVLTPGYALTRLADQVDFFVTEPRNPNASVDGEYWFFPYQPGSAVMRADQDPTVAVGIPWIDE